MLEPLKKKLEALFHVNPVVPAAPAPTTAPAPTQQPVTLSKDIGLKTLTVKNVQTPNPSTAVPVKPQYLFDTQQNSQHSVREICDLEGLNLYEKSVIYACIEQESQFYNYLPSGKPTIHENYAKDGKTLLSTDWGICQINDTHGWYIGTAPLPFPSVDFLMANPDKAVMFMCRMAIEGELGKWVSYSSGAYEKFMPTNLLGKCEQNGGRF